MNAALHRIAVTQWHGLGPGRTYATMRMAAIDAKTEALRALRRRLSDVVFRLLIADEEFHREEVEHALLVAA